ncbi:MAG: 50S ribosomal protein L6 [bacterium]|nr:50S ribosomal protein L6 [bacterium]
MSKIGKKPIIITTGIEMSLKDGFFEIKGKLGTIKLKALPYIKADIQDGTITLTPQAKHKQARANWGTMAALLKNAILGVSEGFTKELEIKGIGFSAVMEGDTLVLKVGFSHPVKFRPADGVKVTSEKGLITVTGIDRAVVGEVAAQIRRIKKPEPYKGKGIKYKDEIIRRKAGKKVAGATAGS